MLGGPWAHRKKANKEGSAKFIGYNHPMRVLLANSSLHILKPCQETGKSFEIIELIFPYMFARLLIPLSLRLR